MDKQIVKLAFCFGGWAHGGYVRDVIVCKTKNYEDIDLCFGDGDDVDSFVASLDVLGTVEVYEDIKSVESGVYGIKNITRKIGLVVNSDTWVDICVIQGGFDAWVVDRSADLSCNLFYKSYDCPLGLRYIPSIYKQYADPAEHIIELTKNKRFDRVWGEEDTSDYDMTVKNMDTILGRIKKMEDRGWDLWNAERSERM